MQRDFYHGLLEAREDALAHPLVREVMGPHPFRLPCVCHFRPPFLNAPINCVFLASTDITGRQACVAQATTCPVEAAAPG